MNFLFIVLSSFFYISYLSCSNIVYIYAEGFGSLFPHVSCNNVTYNAFTKLRLKLNELGIELRQCDNLENLPNFKSLVVFNINPRTIHQLRRFAKEKLSVVLWEPPTVNPDNYRKEYLEYFSKIFTWNDALIDNKKFYKFIYFYPNLQLNASPVPFYQRKLCTLIARQHTSHFNGELYTARDNIIRFFDKYYCNDLDVYGYGWEKIAKKIYRGQIGDKTSVMHNYKFCICYENTYNLPGYITEKIFDCFKSGCIPIYWGAPNIQEYIPKNCYIDRRDFANDESLYQYLKAITEDDHNKYINNIDIFLNNESSQIFSENYFAEYFSKIILNN